jgi:hypothetical protein
MDLEKDLYACIAGEMQEEEPKADERSNLHEDEYPNPYYNYYPVKVDRREGYPPKEEVKTPTHYTYETL